MNGAVIGLSVVVGVILGGLIWWFKRSVLGALVVPLVLVSLVTIALPRAVEPIAAPDIVTPPTVVEPGQATDAVQEDLPTTTKLAAFRPIEVSDHGYIGSEACRDCHPQNHESWFASYHRTMTQVATPDVILGDFNDVKLSQNGRDYQLRRADDACWVEMLDPAAIPGSAAASQRVQRPIVMSTGSHHMQAYWFPVGARRTLAILPFVFLNETQEWIPRSAAFLKPSSPGVSHEIGRWNASCSTCHSTHPQEREMTDSSWDTYAAEFGIGCEACHGPGQQHLEHHRDSTVGKNMVADASLDPIVNPDLPVACSLVASLRPMSFGTDQER